MEIKYIKYEYKTEHLEHLQKNSDVSSCSQGYKMD